jgi:RNA polymerase sigma-70 factor (ECF subfamily)
MRHDGMNERELVAYACSGNTEACDRLLGLYRDQLAAFCAVATRDHHDRDELLQLVMIRVWRGLPGFDGRSALSTWLYRIVRNTAVSEFERKARHPVPIDPLEAPTFVAPGDVEERVVLHDSLERAAAGLRPPFRAVSELVDHLGFSPADVARLCDIPEVTVRTRLWRARRMMREQLLAEAS